MARRTLRPIAAGRRIAMEGRAAVGVGAKPAGEARRTSRSSQNNESAIRVALKNKLMRHQRGDASVLVIDELGLAHAKSRVDLAVFNGHLHGYEIKSANDTLLRLPAQLNTYSESLEKLTLVIATRHLASAISVIPEWCGLIEILEGPRGGIKLKTHKRPKLNPNVDPYIFAHLLWRSEAQALLRLRGLEMADINVPRKHLYKHLSEHVPLKELSAAIKSAMVSRTRWRDQSLPL